MKKRFFSVLLSAAILVSAVGCAKNSEGSSQGGSNKPGQSGTSGSGHSSDFQMKEIEKAISLGIVPDDIQEDYGPALRLRNIHGC